MSSPATDTATSEHQPEENKQLHTLNDRLQNYILETRKRESLLGRTSSELEQQRLRHERDLQSLQGQWQQELQALRERREAQDSMITDLQRDREL